MSDESEVFVHPHTHARVRVGRGWSWPCLAWGPFWFLHQRMPMWFLVSLLAVTATLGLAWLLLPAVANALHRLHVVEAGWLPLVVAPGDGSGTASTLGCPSCAQPIARTAERCLHCGTSILPWPWAP